MTIGYDNLNLNSGLLVDITMDEMTGTITHDRAKAHHKFTLSGGAAWGSVASSGLPRIFFDGVSDFLQCPAADSADTNFTSGNFSMAAWIYSSLGGGAEMILNQGTVDVDGFEFFAFGTTLSFRLNQAGAHTDISAVNAIVANTWQLVGLSRFGANGAFIVNGVGKATAGTLTNAISCAGSKKLLVGVQDNEATNFFGGYIAGGPCSPKIWNRSLPTAEWLQLYESGRHWLGI